jgi:cytochrome oxidase Cu insertion factor (SCO1/SenC/PrrC family)
MPKKEKKKKSWKERQRERQLRQQRAQEAYQIQREREAEKKPRKWPKGKMIFGFCLIVLVFSAYGTWQYFEGQKPPAIGGTTNNPPPTGSAPSFSLKDINGTQFSLSQHSGKVIAVHFMAVGCSGQIYDINKHQLTQLKEVCNNYCGDDPVTMVTVAVATCPNSQLSVIRANYGITWVLGNDYDDGKMDIVNAYTSYSINDGTIVLIDKTFNVAKVYTETTSAETLSSKINQLLQA